MVCGGGGGIVSSSFLNLYPELGVGLVVVVVWFIVVVVVCGCSGGCV